MVSVVSVIVRAGQIGGVIALAGLVGAAGHAETTQTQPLAGEDAELMLVLDASASMLEIDAGGAPRIDSARQGLDDVIGRLDSEQRVGVRVFGAESGGASACENSELLVPIDSGNHDALAAAVAGYAPGGEAPIGFALQQAAGDLGSEGRRSILLVADGEDTCGHDPCEVARDLAAGDLDLVINVVGLNVDGGARDDLRCIARVGHGTYFDALSADTIAAAVGRLAARAVRPAAVSGIPVTGTAAPEGAPELSAGNAYADILGAIGETRYYRIRRTAPGSSIHVGFHAVLGQLQITPFEVRDWSDGWVELKIETVDGESCGFDTQMRLGGAWPLLASEVTIFADPDVEHEPCIDANELRLSVTLTDFDEPIAGTPFELVVYEERRVQPGLLLPDSAEPGNVQWQPMKPDGAGGRVVGGSSFYDAPTVDAGSYLGELLPGETAVFRVRLDWGQWLQAQADFPTPAAGHAEAFEPGTFGSIDVISPNGGNVTEELITGTDALSSYWIWPTETSQLATATLPVRWWNRVEGERGGASVAGDYFVAISASLDADGDAAVIPFTFTVGVFGTAGEGAPSYEGDTAGVSSTPAATAPDTVGPPPDQQGEAVEDSQPDRDSDDKVSPILLGLLGGAGAGIAGHGAVRLLRRRPVAR